MLRRMPTSTGQPRGGRYTPRLPDREQRLPTSRSSRQQRVLLPNLFLLHTELGFCPGFVLEAGWGIIFTGDNTEGVEMAKQALVPLISSPPDLPSTNSCSAGGNKQSALFPGLIFHPPLQERPFGHGDNSSGAALTRNLNLGAQPTVVKRSSRSDAEMQGLAPKPFIFKKLQQSSC